MNNKKLAIALSIIAVILVLYQFVLKKSDKPKIKRNNTSFVQNKNLDNPGGNPLGTSNNQNSMNTQMQVNNQQQMPVNTNQANNGNRMKNELIDFNSEILLNRVYENDIEYLEKKELPHDIGVPIFVKELYQQKEDLKEKGELKEVIFKLNAIIIKQEGKYAIINEKILKIGDNVSGAIVKDIKKSKVLLEFKGKDVILSTNSKIKKIRYLGGRSEK